MIDVRICGTILLMTAGALVDCGAAPQDYSVRRPTPFGVALVRNEGQFRDAVRGAVIGGRAPILIEDDGLSLDLGSGEGPIRMRWSGAERDAPLLSSDRRPGHVNYLTGKSPASWTRGVERYGRLVFRDFYPNIDLVYHVRDERVEYDLDLRPGATLEAAEFVVEGVAPGSLWLDSEGRLVIDTPLGPWVHGAPFAYQDVDGSRAVVSCQYELRSENRVGFRVERPPLEGGYVIDPVLAYSSFLGGSNVDELFDGAVDDDGNVYVVGRTLSADAPVLGELATLLGINGDAYIAKLDPEGQLVYATYVGGALLDRALAVDVDADGAAYIVGETLSADFPVVGTGAFGDPDAVLLDGFVMRLNPAGDAIDYSTYLGGLGPDRVSDVVVDDEVPGRVFVIGDENSLLWPPGSTDLTGVDGYVARLDFAAGTLATSAIASIGGSLDDLPSAIDRRDGVMAIVGRTLSGDLPTTGGVLQPTADLLGDAFVMSIDDSLATIWSTYLGGELLDVAADVAINALGEVLVVGSTASTTFVTSGTALQNTVSGASDAFVARLAADGTALIAGTVFGGTGADAAEGVAVTASGLLHVVGTTESADLPVLGSLSDLVAGTLSGGNDGFLAVVNDYADALLFSTYLGGSGDDMALDVEVDSDGASIIVGQSASVEFPILNALQGLGGLTDGVIARVTYGVDDSNLLVEEAGFEVDWAAHVAASPLADELGLCSWVSPEGLPDDASGMTVTLQMNGVDVAGTVMLDQDGRFESPNGASPAISISLDTGTGQLDISVGSMDGREVFDVENETGSGTTVVSVVVSLGGSLAETDTFYNHLVYDYDSVMDERTIGTYTLGEAALDGAFFVRQAIAKKKNKKGYKFTVKATIDGTEPDGYLPSVEEAATAVSIRIGDADPIEIPMAHLKFKESGDGTTVQYSKSKAKKSGLPLPTYLRSFTIKSSTNFIQVKTKQMKTTGLPEPSKGSEVEHEIEIHVTIHTESGPAIYEAMRTMVRAKSTKSKWVH